MMSHVVEFLKSGIITSLVLQLRCTRDIDHHWTLDAYVQYVLYPLFYLYCTLLSPNIFQAL